MNQPIFLATATLNLIGPDMPPQSVYSASNLLDSINPIIVNLLKDFPHLVTEKIHLEGCIIRKETDQIKYYLLRAKFVNSENIFQDEYYAQEISNINDIHQKQGEYSINQTIEPGCGCEKILMKYDGKLNTFTHPICFWNNIKFKIWLLSIKKEIEQQIKDGVFFQYHSSTNVIVSDDDEVSENNEIPSETDSNADDASDISEASDVSGVSDASESIQHTEQFIQNIPSSSTIRELNSILVSIEQQDLNAIVNQSKKYNYCSLHSMINQRLENEKKQCQIIQQKLDVIDQELLSKGTDLEAEKIKLEIAKKKWEEEMQTYQINKRSAESTHQELLQIHERFDKKRKFIELLEPIFDHLKNEIS